MITIDSFLISPDVGDAPLFVSHSADVSGSLNYSVTWDFGDGGYSNNQFGSYEYAAPGVYQASVTVTDSEDFSSDTRSQTITVNDPFEQNLISDAAAFFGV